LILIKEIVRKETNKDSESKGDEKIKHKPGREYE